MPKRHGNSKLDTVVERAEEIDDPFIQRFKLREGWKVVYNNLLNDKRIRFFIDNIEYQAIKFDNMISLINIKTENLKNFKSNSEIKDLCRVIITSDKWEVLF